MNTAIGVPTPVVSVSPVVLRAPTRGEDLRIRVSAPTTGQALPIILFSHGYGSSFRAYGPLVDFWTGHGFAVIQPTHLDSREVGLPPDDPRRRELWRFRVEDMKRVLDDLDAVETAVPGLEGRLDRSRTAAAGHSFGGQTTAVLLGARVLGQQSEHMSDPRVKAGVLMATAGRGGADVKPEAAEQFPWLNPSFAGMTTPALVIAGDADASPFTTRGPDWSEDPYRLSPGPKSLITLHGGAHSLGGIPGYESAETTDENPAMVAAVQRMTWAFLRSALYPEDTSWAEAKAAFMATPEPVGRIESK